MDILVSGVKALSDYSPYHAPHRSAAYATVQAINFARPGVLDDLDEEASLLYKRYCGDDVPSNLTALSLDDIKNALAQHGVNCIDVGAQFDRTTEDGLTALRHEIASGENNGLIHLLLIAHPDKLVYPQTKKPLFAGIEDDANVPPHALIRNGYATDKPIGYYASSGVAGSFGVSFPLALEWPNVVQAGIVACLAILKDGVEVPPADFRYFKGFDAEGKPVTNTWPVAQPKVDLEAMKGNVQAILQAHADERAKIEAQQAQLDAQKAQLAQSMQATDAANASLLAILHELGLKDA